MDGIGAWSWAAGAAGMELLFLVLYALSAWTALPGGLRGGLTLSPCPGATLKCVSQDLAKNVS